MASSETNRIYSDPVSNIRCVAGQTHSDPGIMFYVANDNDLLVVVTDYDNRIGNGIRGTNDHSPLIPLEHKWALLSAMQAGMTWIDRIRSVRPYSVPAVVPDPAGSPETIPQPEF